MIPEGKVIPMNETDQLKLENYKLRLAGAQQELQMIELTMALMQLRHPIATAALKALQAEGKNYGPSGN